MTEPIKWDELSLEVINAARLCMTVKDFEIHCRLAPLSNGKSYFDRIRVAESMISDGVVRLVDGQLRLPHGALPNTLLDALCEGSKIAWDILDSIDPAHKYLRKVDHELLSMIGLSGEMAVIEELRLQLSDSQQTKVVHVSRFDDTAGFDIKSPSIRNSDDIVLLEVKTCCRPSEQFSFFISTNEARVGRQNKNWFLVGIEPLRGGYQVVGHITFDMFSDYLPTNVSPFGEWDTAKVVLSKNVFVKGLP